MKKKISFSVFLWMIGLINLHSQILNPVHWKFHINDKSEIVLKATIDAGWHLYGTDIPDGGPTPTSFSFESIQGAELVGKIQSASQKTTKYDDLFSMELSWYDREATFIQAIKISAPNQFSLTGNVKFMACNDETCMMPTVVDFSFSSADLPRSLVADKPATSEPVARETPALSPATVVQDTIANAVSQTQTPPVTDLSKTESVDLWKPVIQELQQYGNKTTEKSWAVIFFLGFLGGLVALMTPCVWPIIPMTVSFFLKRSKSNTKKAIADAFTFGLSIIVIYLMLGLIITAIFGASALNELSTSAIFNLLFFALLVVFAISFFGAFELTLPSSWTTKMDRKADTTSGLLSIFFMAFTLVLVSFSCTGPIIGTLLVEAAGMGSMGGPAIGMFGFALALAIPFALFAIFPSWLQNLPKSGGWLNSVKVVLGFLELALALKFLSVADLAYKWKILDREVFLVLWIVIFVLLGFYLLGKIKFSHDSEIAYVSVPRLFLAIISFAFAIYIVPGLWGAPLKAISAFAPPLYTQDFRLYTGVVEPKFYDYEAGMAAAQSENKPVIIDFTGYGCVNCRNMEAAVWTDPRVKDLLENQFILISLYVDDKTDLTKPIEITEYGKLRKLKTIGDKWSYLQRYKFGANAQPFYVILDNNGMPIAPSYAYDKNVDHFLKYLREGIKKYKEVNKK